MKKSILEFYALAVCFVTLIVFTVTLGVGVYNIVELVNPELTMNAWEWEKYQSNDTFFEQMQRNYDEKGNIDSRSDYDNDEITKKRESGFKIALKSVKRGALQSLIRVLIILTINIIVFIPHWKLAKKSRKD